MIPHAVVAGLPEVKSVTISKDKVKKDGYERYKYDFFVEGNVFKQILQLEEVGLKFDEEMNYYFFTIFRQTLWR